MPRRTMLAALALTLTTALVAASLIASAAGGLQGVLAPGETQHVTITANDDLGVVAGLVTTRTHGPFGLDLGARETPEADGWVVLHPQGEAPDAETALAVTDETPFEDPNGATWLSREVRYDGTTAWAVPLGTPHEDATLEGEYNFAMIVDFSEVPDGATLQATYHDALTLDHP